MNVDHLQRLLEGIQKGKVKVERAMQELKMLPFEEIGCATIDHHRSLRQGAPETIFGEGKTAAQMISIMKKMQEKRNNILVTRLERAKVPPIKRAFPKAKYYPQSRTLTFLNHPVKMVGRGTILVVCAGTSDIPVAEEAMVTARMIGEPRRALIRRGGGRNPSLDESEGKADGCPCADCGCRNGGGTAQRSRGIGRPASDRGSHERGVWLQLRGHHGASGHAQLLCFRDSGRQYR